MWEQLSTFLLDQTATPTLLLAVAFIAQSLKEIGIPSPGVTQGLLILAGSQFVNGDFAMGSAIILLTILGSVAGATTAYAAGRTYGAKLANRWAKYIRGAPRALQKARQRRLSCPILIVSRSIPGLMAATSLTAGAMHLPVRHFLLSVTISTVVWAAVLGAIGGAFGGFVTGAIPTQYVPPSLGFLALLGVTAGLLVLHGTILKKA